MVNIYLVRHGETDWNLAGRLQGSTDIPLNELGKQSALKTAEYFRANDIAISCIMTSPLTRAKQTAEIISTVLEIPVIEVQALTERCFGEAEGLTAEERTLKFPDQDIPGLEDIQVVRERVWNVLQTFTSAHADESIIIVSHGGVINAVLSILSNGEIGTGITKLKNACLNHITYSNDEWTIHSYNNILHLER